MSTFTKVLVVLLSLSCIFLCGSVITYVGSTSNVMQENENLKTDVQALQSKSNNDARLYNEKIKESDLEIQQLKGQIVGLESDRNQMMIDLKNAQRATIKWQDRVNSWAGVVKSFEQTIGEMQKSLALTRDQLGSEQNKSIKVSNQLNDLTIALDEHIVMLESLKAEKRRLLEQKAMLEDQVTALSTGKEIPVCEPVTQLKGTARPADVAVAGAVRGLITEVGSNLVALSVGSTDGVQEGMKFHVTRGDSFICDLLITDVDVDKCAGIIDLKYGVPKVGDTASTEL